MDDNVFGWFYISEPARMSHHTHEVRARRVYAPETWSQRVERQQIGSRRAGLVATATLAFPQVSAQSDKNEQVGRRAVAIEL
jgi:hypothetical protein